MQVNLGPCHYGSGDVASMTAVHPHRTGWIAVCAEHASQAEHEGYRLSEVSAAVIVETPYREAPYPEEPAATTPPSLLEESHDFDAFDAMLADSPFDVEAGVGVVVEMLKSVDERDAAAISRLVPQVSTQVTGISTEQIRQVAGGPHSRIVVARLDDEIVGSATLVILVTLVGRFGYVEEVAVDRTVRGRGIGRALMQGVLSAAGELELDFVELTSRPSREAANALYRSLGFARRDTNVYRYDLR